MKIAVTDAKTYQELGMDFKEFKQFGDLDVFEYTSEDEVISKLKDYEILVTNKTVLNENSLKALPNLKMICEMATGYNNIDVIAANSLGISVYNVPNYSTASVVQHTYALLLEVCNKISHYNMCVQYGLWTKNKTVSYLDEDIIELDGLTCGLIGYGNIGKASAKVAQSLGMKVITYNKLRETDIESVTLDELYERSDIILLHCSLNQQNANMIDLEAVRKLKKGVIIINTARGGLIDESALKYGLDEDIILGAGLDVVSSEYIREDNPLLHHEKVVITPHVAWGSRASINRLYNLSIENIKAYLSGDETNKIK